MRQKWGVRAALALLTFGACGVFMGNNHSANLCAAVQHAATGSIQGTLVNPKGKPVGNATVSLMTIPGRGQMAVLLGTATTDSKGKFNFKSIAPGTDRIVAATLSLSVDQKVTVYANVSTQVVLILP